MSDFAQWKGRAEVTGEIGTALAKDLSAAETTLHHIDGRLQALAVIQDKTVPSLHARVDAELAEDPEAFNIEPLQVAALVKRYITRMHEASENLKELAKAERIVAVGRRAGIEASMQVVQNYHSGAVSRASQLGTELAERLEARARAEESGEPVVREPRGGRPSREERRKDAAE